MYCCDLGSGPHAILTLTFEKSRAFWNSLISSFSSLFESPFPVLAFHDQVVQVDFTENHLVVLIYRILTKDILQERFESR